MTNFSVGELPRVYLDSNPLVSLLETTLDYHDMASSSLRSSTSVCAFLSSHKLLYYSEIVIFCLKNIS